MKQKSFLVLVVCLFALGGVLVLGQATPTMAQEGIVEADEPLIPQATKASARTYTLDGDFSEGVLINVNYTDVADQLQLDKFGSTFPFIWIAKSGTGTIVKVNTEPITRSGQLIPAGTVLGEYQASPNGMQKNPSRTTVDMNGNVWVGNRNEGGGGLGSVVHIGLLEHNQCVDRNGNGQIDTSTGLGDVKSWSNAGGADTNGGVTTAEDECIIHYVRTSGTYVRHVSVDANNDVWVGGFGNRKFNLIDGATGSIKKTVGPFPCGGYGGLIDGNGVLWSARLTNSGLLRYDPATGQHSCLPVYAYGMNIDTSGNIWVAEWTRNRIAKVSSAGQVLGRYSTGGSCSRGVATTADDGNVWVANSCSSNVGRLDSKGNLVARIPVGSTPTGVAVDAAGKVWVTNYSSNNAMRIDPATNQVDLTVNLGANARPYNYSDMTGIIALAYTAPQGTWTVTYDSEAEGTAWGTISWNSLEENNSSITVQARAADTKAGLGGVAYVSVDNAVKTDQIPAGRYIEVKVKFRPGDEQADGLRTSPILYDLTITPANNCVLTYDKIANPDWVEAGSAVTVALSMRAVGECDALNSPADVMLVLDRSGSMGGNKMTAAKGAAKAFIDKMSLPPDQVGVASFQSSASTDAQLGQDAAVAKAAIDGLSAGGGTNMQAGLEFAEAELISARHVAKNVPVIIILSDGHHNRTPVKDLMAAATRIKGMGIRIISIGLGNHANEAQLKALASSADDYYFAPSAGDLGDIYDKIAPTMRVAARNMVLTDTMSSLVTLIPDTFGGSLTPTVKGEQLIWNVPVVPVNGMTLTYQVAMTSTAGNWPTNDSAIATYTDPNNETGVITFPVPSVIVPLRCTQPDLSKIEPVWACVDESKDVDIFGSGFFKMSAAIARTLNMSGTFSLDAAIGPQDLDVRSYSHSLINAFLPAKSGLQAGKYDVTVMNTCALTRVSPRHYDDPDAVINFPDPVMYKGVLQDGFRLYGAPKILSIRPPEAYNDIPTELTICGDGFAPGTKAYIEINGALEELDNQSLHGEICLVGTVQEGLDKGDYDIVVKGPCGEERGTFRVLASDLNDDLWALPEDMKILADGDLAFCLPDCQKLELGLIVRRRGGKNPVEVNVGFYEGDPALGATLIGTGTIPMMSPGVPVPPDFSNTAIISGVSTSLVEWNPSQGAISYTLYAFIDYTDIVSEDIEVNNILSRTVYVLPCSARPDRVAPVVEEFVIATNNDADVTYDPEVGLNYSARDFPQPGPNSGVARVAFVEYLYQRSSMLWVPVQVSGWAPYTGKADLTLHPAGGLRFIQAWASDQAGNISRFPNFKYVNYVKPCDYVPRNGVKIYRQNIDVGEKLYVEIVPCDSSSDPDLYIWPPDWSNGEPPYVSNISGNAVDDLYITQTVKGEYMIEVYGYSPAKYNINIEVEPAGAALNQALLDRMAERSAARLAENPQMLFAPSLRGDSTPSVGGIPVSAAPFAQPLESVTLDGPTTGWVNTPYRFAASITPDVVMLPITYTWEATGETPIVNVYNQDTALDRAAFTWESPGMKTVTVTVTTADGDVQSDTLDIKIDALPMPEDSIQVWTSSTMPGETNKAYAFTAQANITMSVAIPQTYIWSATDHLTPTTRTVLGKQDVYSFTWTTPGTKTVTVTVQNPLGSRVGTCAFSVVSPPSEVITAEVTPEEGGTLVYPADGITINVLPGVVTQTIELRYTPHTSDTLPSGQPSNMYFANLAFSLDAYISDTLKAGLTFSPSITITIQYNADYLTARDLDANTLKLYYTEGWVAISTTPGPGAGKVTAVISHLSDFVLLAEKEKEGFSIYLPLVLRKS